MGKKFSNGHKYDNFEPEEFYCPCCGKEEMDHSFMQIVEIIRIYHGKVIRVADGGGWRCREYDKSNGAHPEGKAMDPLYHIDDHFELMRLAFLHGLTGIGDKQKDGQYKMHWDNAEPIPGKRIRPRKWTYNTNPKP